MTQRFTYTKTFNVLTPWAETLPWACLVRPTNCISPTHNHTPMVNDPCAVEDCGERLIENEVCYGVVEIPGRKWVCWRHVRPDEGPIRVPRTESAGLPTSSEDKR